MQSPWMTRKQAAEYVGLSVDRLAALSSRGTGGPKFAKAPGARGAVRYHRDWLDEWLGAPVTSAHEAREREKRRTVQDAA